MTERNACINRESKYSNEPYGRGEGLPYQHHRMQKKANVCGTHMVVHHHIKH